MSYSTSIQSTTLISGSYPNLSPYVSDGSVILSSSESAGEEALDTFLSCPNVKELFDALLSKVNSLSQRALKINFVRSGLEYQHSGSSLGGGEETSLHLNIDEGYSKSFKIFDLTSSVILLNSPAELNKIANLMGNGKLSLTSYESKMLQEYHRSSLLIDTSFKKCAAFWNENNPNPPTPRLDKYFVQEQLIGQLDTYRKNWLQEGQAAFCSKKTKGRDGKRKLNSTKHPFECSLKPGDLHEKEKMNPNPNKMVANSHEAVFASGNKWLEWLKKGKLKYPEPLKTLLKPLKEYSSFEKVIVDWYSKQE